MRNDHNRQFAVAEFKSRNEKGGYFAEYAPEKDHYRMDEAFFQSFICPGSSHTLLHFKDFYYYTTKNRLCQIKTKYLKRFIDDT